MKQISAQQIRVYQLFETTPDKWWTNSEIRQALGDVSRRAVTHHTRELTTLGVLDRAETFPDNKYRLAQKTVPYIVRLHQAAEMLGLSVAPQRVA
jgi:hypothetical protein